MSANIHVFDPNVMPARRLMTVDGARHYAHVLTVAWTSQERCAWHPNPKRPSWRCKAAPTHSVQLAWLRDNFASGVPSILVCEPHVAEVLSRNYVVGPRS